MEAAHKAMADPGFREKAAAISGVDMANTPEQFAAQIQQALDRYRKVAQAAGLRIE